MSELFSGLANLSKQLQNAINSDEVRKISDKVQGYVLNYTEIELKVREATSEEPWGPTGQMIAEISKLTYQYDAFPEVMGMIWRRMLQDNRLAWRRVYKSLVLLHSLLKQGSERVVSNARDRVFEMRALENYACVDDRGRDQGINIRIRVKQILELLQDDEMLAEERRKTKSDGKDKYQGYSREDMMMKGKMSSFDSWSENKQKARKDSFELPEPRSSNREVNSFDFNRTDNRSVSPELGYADEASRASAIVEDDEFGDFADTRTSSAAAKQPARGVDALDLFGDTVAASSTGGARIPKPPSGPSSPRPGASGGRALAEASLFDLNGDFDLPSSASVSAAAPKSTSNGAVFNIFDDAPVSTPAASQLTASADLFGNFAAAPPPSQPAFTATPSRPANDLDDVFGAFSSGSGQPSAPSNGAASLDSTFFGSQPSAATAAAPPPPAAAAKPALSNEWSLLEKQLDGLMSGTKSKPAPSMNAMRAQRQ